MTKIISDSKVTNNTVLWNGINTLNNTIRYRKVKAHKNTKKQQKNSDITAFN